MNTHLRTILGWAKKNERHLSGAFFLFGFLGDILTFSLLNVSIVNVLFLGYIALAAFCTLGDQWLSRKPASESEKNLTRVLRVLFPLGVQFFVSSVLSGSLIFYTKSSVIAVSWPFLLLLALVFFGNEFLRDYRTHLAFQTVLLFFGLYAYAIFALPLVLKVLGPVVFLESSALALLAFLLFLLALYRIESKRVRASASRMAVGICGVLILVNAAYFTGLIPPIPLTLKQAGVYHSVERTGDTYTVTTEAAQPWWDFSPEVIHHVPGTPLYTFSSVFAPFQFSAGVVHVWEWQDPVSNAWVEKSRIAFPISGGRVNGYRGYSIEPDPAPGLWRVSIETTEGQIVGRREVIVVDVPTLFDTHVETY